MNFLRSVRRIIFFLCLTTKIPLTAETMGISLLEHLETKKKVAIIHDRHTDVFVPQKIDDGNKHYLQQQRDEVQHLFAQLKSKETSSTAVIELPEFSWKTEQWDNSGIVLGDTQKTVYEHGWKQGSVQFVTCDHRSNDDIIISAISMHYNRFKEYDDYCKKEQKETPYVFVGPRIKTYLQSITERYRHFSTLVEHLHSHNGIPKNLKDMVLQRLSRDFKCVSNIIEEIVSNSNDIKEESSILDLFLGIKDRQRLATSILNENLYACDIPLLSQVMKCSDDICVVHVGMQHGALLYEQLVACGFTAKDSKVCMKVEKEGPYGYKTPKRVPHNISTIIMAFFDTSSLDDILVQWDETIDITEEDSNVLIDPDHTTSV